MNDLVVCWTLFNYFLFPFKGWKSPEVHPVLTAEWISGRYDIWKRYTYPSIAIQSGKFVYYMMCNIQAKHITDSVFSQITKEDPRVKLLYFGTKNYNDTMKLLRENYDATYAIRVDSDDMYSYNTFEYLLTEFPKSEQYGYFQRGYGYCPYNGKLWHYDCLGSGPFYVQKYAKGMYRFDPVEHTYIRSLGAAILEDGHFIVSVHEMNHSTIVKPPRFGDELHGLRKVNTLKRFLHK
jgi:hypothetical protein